jgi:4-methoxybenzoate monooxygenase (O-demethylating)
MTTMTDAQAIVTEEDPFTKQAIDNPFPMYERFRDAGPVLWLKSYNCYAVARYEEVRKVESDWKNFSSAAGTGLRNYRKDKPWREPGLVLETDPPVHTKHREIFSRVLSPVATRHLREIFDVEANRLVDRALDMGVIDGIADLAQAFTLKIFPDAVGLPPDDRHKLLEYGDMQLHSFIPPDWMEADPFEGVEELSAWVTANCRRDALSDDGFGAAIDESVDKGEITESAAQNLVRSFLSAGVDNSITSFGNAFWSFAKFPDQWTKLRERPELIRDAYEETLRFLGPLQVNFRTTNEDTELAGVRLRGNEKVAVFLASANRDPRKWPNPDALNVEVRPSGHMAFGMGIHGCVGQILARIEAESLFGALAKKVRTFELVGEPTRRYISVLQSYSHLPLRVIPA